MIKPGRHQEQIVEKFVGLPWNLIGDSMGTGKTLSGVILDQEERKLRPGPFRTLIVCTKGGLSVWKWHLEDQGVPSSRIFVIDPADRGPFDAELNSGANNFDYYIMHYSALDLLEFFEKPQIGRGALVWDHIIADEVHLIKNRNAIRSKTLKRQRALKRTGCSGTPADDKPQDIWSILNWLDRKKYSSYWRFVDRYVSWTQEYNYNSRNGYRKLGDPKNIDEFHREIHLNYIRRTLPEVRGSMPPKTHSSLWVDLTPGQMSNYRDMEKFQIARLEELDQEYTVLWAIALHQILQRMTIGTVVEIDWSKYEAFWERHRDTPLDDLPKHAPTGPKLIMGEPSPKLDLVMEKAEEAMDAGESLVVMSCYRDMTKMVAERCRKAKIPSSLYHGGILKQSVRDAAVADFQSGRTKVFAGTIAAAGTSITLTAAQTLIFTDRHWNPSVNRQAEDRIWRYDSQDPVQIITTLARDTVDAGKLAAIEVKGKRIDRFVEIPDEYKDRLEL